MFVVKLLDKLFDIELFAEPCIGAATLAAGILIVRLAPSARSIGLAVCAVCLAYQAYAFGFGLFRAATIPNLPVLWGFMLLSFGYLVLFAAAAICLRPVAAGANSAVLRPAPVPGGPSALFRLNVRDSG